MRRRLVFSATLVLCLSACGSRHAQVPDRAVAHPSVSKSEHAPRATGQSGTSSSETASASTGSAAATHSVASDATSALTGTHATSNGFPLPVSSRWKRGVNYTVLSPAQPLSVSPGKVEVLEVFWLACPHCYALEPYMREWRKSKPDYVDFVRVPVMWGAVQQAHARLFYTLEALGRDDLVETAFHSLHRLEQQKGTESVLYSPSKSGTLRLQRAWAQRHGIAAAKFSKAYKSFYVNTQLQQAAQVTQAYQVTSVPFIAVDGRYITNEGMAGGPRKLISLINFLAAWDHDHPKPSAR